MKGCKLYKEIYSKLIKGEEITKEEEQFVTFYLLKLLENGEQISFNKDLQRIIDKHKKEISLHLKTFTICEYSYFLNLNKECEGCENKGRVKSVLDILKENCFKIIKYENKYVYVDREGNQMVVDFLNLKKVPSAIEYYLYYCLNIKYPLALIGNQVEEVEQWFFETHEKKSKIDDFVEDVKDFAINNIDFIHFKGDSFFFTEILIDKKGYIYLPTTFWKQYGYKTRKKDFIKPFVKGYERITVGENRVYFTVLDCSLHPKLRVLFDFVVELKEEQEEQKQQEQNNNNNNQDDVKELNTSNTIELNEELTEEELERSNEHLEQLEQYVEEQHYLGI